MISYLHRLQNSHLIESILSCRGLKRLSHEVRYQVSTVQMIFHLDKPSRYMTRCVRLRNDVHFIGIERRAREVHGKNQRVVLYCAYR